MNALAGAKSLDMSEKTDDRPILPAWAVKDGDKITFIHLERGPAEAIAAHTSMAPDRRLIKIWIREQADE